MSCQNVLVLGATGMLGRMVAEYFACEEDVRLLVSSRHPKLKLKFGSAGIAQTVFVDAERADAVDLRGIDWVVNCIGVIKPFINDREQVSVTRAIRVNSLFPSRLADAAEHTDTRVIQIATDCVYSGRDGCYLETAPHDATDVYGKTKSLGELRSSRIAHLRCSIVGPETTSSVSLLGWFLSRARGARINGYRNHLWNGITTTHFAKLCAGIVRADLALPHLTHVVPADDVSKAELLHLFAQVYGRGDIDITPMETEVRIDRRLRTVQPELNGRIWSAAGYDEVPTIARMVSEMGSIAPTIVR